MYFDSFKNPFPAEAAVFGNGQTAIINAIHTNKFISYLREVMSNGGLVEWKGDRAVIIFQNYRCVEMVLTQIKPVERVPQLIPFQYSLN